MRGIVKPLGVFCLFIGASLPASADQIAILPTDGSIWVNISTPSLLYQVGVLEEAPDEFTATESFLVATFSGSFSPVAGGIPFVSDLAGPSFGELTSRLDVVPDLTTSGWVSTGVAFSDFASNPGSLFLELVSDIPSSENFSAVEAFIASLGDANLNGTVDVDDASILMTNFGQSSGMTWTDGDFNGDGAIDIDDAGLLLAGFTAPEPSPGPNVIAVTIDPVTLTVSIETSQVALIRLQDPSGTIVDYTPADPTSTANPVTPTLVGEFMLGDVITGTAVITFSEFVNQDVIIGYQLLGGPRVDTVFTLIPEPAGMAVLGLGGLILLRRRQS